MKNRSVLSANREINLPRAVMHPFRRWTSFMRLGACFCSIVTPRMQLAIFVTPTLAIFGYVLCYFFRGRVLSIVLYFVMSCIFISCHHVHCICIRVRLMHPSIFPVVHFAIRRSYLLRRIPLVFFCVRVSNFLGMDRGLSSGLIIPLGDHRSSFVPFGGHLVLQRLTGHPQSPFECPAKTPSKPAQNPLLRI